ncbi:MULTISPECIES: DUF1127 domain-containing protein [unclassified Marinovum]
MAYAQTDARYDDNFSFAAKVYNFFNEVQAFAAKRKVYSATYNELARLDDRELADIGVGRSDIADIARDHAGL